LSLPHARIATEQTLSLQRTAQTVIHLKQCTRNRQPHGPGLTARAATACVNPEIVSVDEFRGLQRLQDRILQRRGRKIIFETAAVDVDLAVPWRHANPGD